VLAVSIENQSYWIRRIQQLSELLDIRGGSANLIPAADAMPRRGGEPEA